jgi:hypothetical protein
MNFSDPELRRRLSAIMQSSVVVVVVVVVVVGPESSPKRDFPPFSRRRVKKNCVSPPVSFQSVSEARNHLEHENPDVKVRQL